MAVIGKADDSSRSSQSASATPARRTAPRLRPLPTTDKLHPLQPPPQGTVRLSVTPQLRTRWNPPLRVRSAKPHGSAPWTVTTTQCGVVCNRTPPAECSGTRRHTVRSQSLATRQRIVCSYLLPGIRRRRSAPASLCCFMANTASPLPHNHLPPQFSSLRPYPIEGKDARHFPMPPRSSLTTSNSKNLSNFLTISSLPHPLFPKITPPLRSLSNRNDGVIPLFTSIPSNHLPVAAERQLRRPPLHPYAPQPPPALRPPAP